VFEKVYNTAEQNARNDGKGRIFEIAAATAIEWSEAQDTGGAGLLLKAKHAVFDKLVYGKLRAALGGNLPRGHLRRRPAWRTPRHFYRGVGLTIYEGYGLTETSAAITVNRVDGLKVGSVGKLLGATACGSMTTANFWSAAAWCSAATGTIRPRPTPCSPMVGSTR